MKVVMVNHGDAGSWGGGDSIQIKETAKRLKQRGYEVDIQNSDRPDIGSADIVHIFNCRVHDSFVEQIATCQAGGKKIVVSPIWISLGRALWGSRCTTAILSKGVEQGEKAIEQDLTMLEDRNMKVEFDGRLIEPNGNGGISPDSIKNIGRLLNQVDGVLTNSWMELKAIQTDLNWKGKIYEIAHYGVDARMFLDASGDIFREKTGIKEKFVLQAGRIEPGKNQAMLCWALRNTGIKVILIGGTKHWPSYAELCRKIYGERLVIIDHLPQEILASAYAAAEVHCLTSWMDTCGLVSLEAAINGTPIVGSTFGHELEYLKGDAWLADPGDPQNIKENIMDAWNAGKYSERSKRLKQRILSDYNWETGTDRTELIYNRVIENA